MASNLFPFVLISLLQISAAFASTALVAQITSASGPDYVVKLQLGPAKQSQLLQLDLNRALSSLACSVKGVFPCTKSSCPLPGETFAANVTINTTNGITDLKPFTVPQVLFECTTVAAVALSNGAQALPSQLAKHGGLAHKFAYCLPGHGSSYPGPIFFGDVGSYIFQSVPAVNLSGLTYTTLLETNLGYAVQLQGITVSDQNLKIKPQNLYISSVEPYTKLATSVYGALRSSFRTNAFYNSTSVPAVAPFDTCFNASSFSSTRGGLGVPQINFLLPNNIIWRIFGINSVMFVSDSVACLAFVDAGPGKPSVLGTMQQQDNFLEFDLEKSRLGFSGLLDFSRTVCADFMF